MEHELLKFRCLHTDKYVLFNSRKGKDKKCPECGKLIEIVEINQ